MSHNLRLFDSSNDASDAADEASVPGVQVLLLDAHWYLKKPGRENVEPEFLCDDDEWRRYDLIRELPGSEAAGD